ncbi:MAG TPA: hypothetical protein VK116_06795, partial [Planctomycetota bacterium]|nr:hypothetical protein [Planctomycetota bacterium]
MLNLDSFPAPACGQIRRAAVVFVLTLASALSFIACSTSLAQAQGAAAEEVATAESGETVYSLLVKGGFLMWPIGLCSIVVLMFAIER